MAEEVSHLGQVNLQAGGISQQEESHTQEESDQQEESQKHNKSRIQEKDCKHKQSRELEEQSCRQKESCKQEKSHKHKSCLQDSGAVGVSGTPDIHTAVPEIKINHSTLEPSK